MLAKKHISLAIGVAIGLAFIAQVPSVVKNIGYVTERQITANNRLSEWKAAYEALMPVNEQWDSTFTSSVHTNDLVQLYRAFRLERHNLVVDADTIMQTGAYSVDVQGVSVGLQRLCIGNTQQSLVLTAAGMAQLRGGLRAVSNRQDIDIGSIRIGFDQDTRQPYAEVKDFCLRVRT